MINARMTESTTCRLTNNCDTPNLCFLSFRFKGYKHVSNYLIPTCSPHGLIDHIPSLHYSNLLFLPRIDAFELLCWRKLMRILWTARRSNQWILKEINPEFSLEGLMLKLQYFGHLIRREGQRSNVWCSPWGHKELDSAEWLNNNNFLIQFTTAIVQLWTNINAGKSEKKRTLLHCQWKGKLVTATMESNVQVF